MSAKILAIVALATLGALAAIHGVHCNGASHNGAHNATYFAAEQTLLAKGVHAVNYEMLFKHYKQIHNLTFGAAEDNTRFTIFKSNCDKIVAHNANKTSSYQLGLTDLAHLTHEEFAATRLGYKAAAKNATKNTVTHHKVTVNTPTEVDWTTKGAVTPIKNQGQCGSCWSFSTTGSLEGLSAIKAGKLVSLSEQELVDCSTSYGNSGCDGGLMDYGFQYAADKGLSTESDYPYTAADGTCQSKKFKRAFQNKAFTDVTADSTSALVAAIAEQPVSVAIEADTDAFQLYKTGVITGDACGTQLDHGVLAVGYGTLKGKAYFKVKNSWGTSWGQEGYVLIGQAKDAGVCGIQSQPSYPTL